MLVGVPVADADTQGLPGPLLQAGLQPGDVMTDLQFRSDFPCNVSPAWFDWKDGLAENGS